MSEEVRPVIELMKARGATKEEIDQMNLYFDKYDLATQRITIESKRRTSKCENVIKQLEDKGYRYSVNTFKNGEVYGYTFTLEDNDGDKFTIYIEDHRLDTDINDFLIWTGLDSGEKNWFGQPIKLEGCVEYSAMKLVMEFIDILKGEEMR